MFISPHERIWSPSAAQDCAGLSHQVIFPGNVHIYTMLTKGFLSDLP